MKKILIATSNAHKAREVKDILNSLNFECELVTPKMLANGKDIGEPVEDGNSFKENSFKKAKFYYDLFKMPTIADDSGLCIDFYNGGPGIYSARWLSELSYNEKNNKICTEMKGSNNRGAKFVCGITYIDESCEKYFEGVINGTIASLPMGNEGFGYDPIFVPNGENVSTAMLGEEYKKYNSHRALALRKMVEDFEK